MARNEPLRCFAILEMFPWHVCEYFHIEMFRLCLGDYFVGARHQPATRAILRSEMYGVIHSFYHVVVVSDCHFSPYSVSSQWYTDMVPQCNC